MIPNDDNLDESASAALWMRQGAGLPEGLRFEVESPPGADSRVALASLRGLGFDARFCVQILSETTPARVLAAITRSGDRVDCEEGHRLFVLPYLSSRTAEVLWSAQISTLDLCGNYQILLPGKMLMRHLGQPNRFPASAPIQDIWGGTSGLVPRVLLLQRRFETATALRQQIEALGGSISKGTVSKVLWALEESLWVRRGEGIVLQHPGALLDAFVEGRRPARVQRRQTVKFTTPGWVIPNGLSSPRAAWLDPGAFVLWGESGQREVLVTDNLRQFLELPGVEAAGRFADAEVIETQDPGVFFALAKGPRGPLVSKLEVFLRLAAGDKRDRDAAAQLRGELLKEDP